VVARDLDGVGQHDLRHGEAVAVGLVFAGELAHRLGRIDADRVAEHRRVVAAYDLPSTLPLGLANDELVELMGRDKKALDGITFVLDGPDGVEQVTGVPRADIDAAIDAVREQGDRP
jgi:5-deoxy-5-amino-3-dehydroquinate synthase